MTESDKQPTATSSQSSGETPERVIAKISNDEVITDGCLIVPFSQKATLYPFSDDPIFGILLDINVAEDPKNSMHTKVDVTGEKSISVNVSRPFSNGRSSVHANIAVSFTDEHKYFLTIIISMVGNKDNFYYDLRYHIARRPK